MVGGDDRDEIGGLLAFDIYDRQLLAGLHFEGTAMSRLNGESLNWICH